MVFNWLVDTIFPINCLRCNAEGKYLCNKCILKQKIELNIQNKEVMTHLDGVMAFFNYDDRVISNLIKRLKYNFETDIIKTIDQLFYRIDNKYGNMLSSHFSDYVVIPVPLHSLRYRTRGFNQSELISDVIVKHSKLNKIYRGLKRIKKTSAQTLLNNTQRRNNLKNSFIWDSKYSIPSKVILVDDVYTTGTTMNQCANVLKNHGTQKVFSLTLARG